MDKVIKKSGFVTLLVAIIVILVYLFRIQIMKTPYYSDELGYWAAGAWMNGIDWSPVFSRSAYYGWGYGVILAPLFLISNSAIRFQAAVFINIMLMLCSYLLLVSINAHIFPHIKKYMISIVSGTTILYSYNIVYAHLTMCESVLIFLFLQSIKAIVNMCENGKIKNYLFFALTLGLQVAVHLRTIVFVLPAGLLMGYLIYHKRVSVKNAVIIVLTAILVMAFVFVIKKNLVLDQYTIVNGSNADINRSISNDSFAQRFSVIRQFTSVDAWKRLLFSIMGKWYYLSCASFFFINFGMYYLFKAFKRSIKDYKEFDKNAAVDIYIIACFAGAFFLSALTLMYSTRFDHVFYGRYVENVVPIMISMGLLTVIENGIKVKKIALYVLCTLAMSIILYCIIQRGNFAGALPLETSGFAGILISGNSDYGTQFTIHAALISTLLSVVIYVLLDRKRLVGCMLLATCWSVIAYRGLELCAYPELERQELIMEAAYKLEASDKTIWTLLPEDLYADITIYVDILWLQYHLGDRTIYVIAETDLENMSEGDIMAISRSYSNCGMIAGQYSDVWQNNKICIIEVP